jgi:hypothetical protein
MTKNTNGKVSVNVVAKGRHVELATYPKDHPLLNILRFDSSGDVDVHLAPHLVTQSFRNLPIYHRQLSSFAADLETKTIALINVGLYLVLPIELRHRYVGVDMPFDDVSSEYGVELILHVLMILAVSYVLLRFR